MKQINSFKPESMRRELKELNIKHFFQEDSYKIDGILRGELSSIWVNIFPEYNDLLSNIVENVFKMANYPFDEQDFRENLKKLDLFFKEVLRNLPDDNKFSQHKSDVTELSRVLNNQVKLMEKQYGKDCYLGVEQITLKS